MICAAFFCMGVAVTVNSARADTHEELPGIAGAPYPNVPGMPPTGVEATQSRARAIYAAILGAQLAGRSRDDASIYDEIVKTYRTAGLIP